MARKQKALDPAVLEQALSVAMKANGSKGGTARAKNLSKEELAKIGSKGAEARWGKKKPKKTG